MLTVPRRPAFSANNMASYKPAWTNKMHMGLSRASRASLQPHTARRRNGRNRRNFRLGAMLGFGHCTNEAEMGNKSLYKSSSMSLLCQLQHHHTQHPVVSDARIQRRRTLLPSSCPHHLMSDLLRLDTEPQKVCRGSLFALSRCPARVDCRSLQSLPDYKD